MLISDVTLQTGAVKLELACRKCGHRVSYITYEPATVEDIHAMDCPKCGRAGG